MELWSNPYRSMGFWSIFQRKSGGGDGEGG